jgi:type IV secretory pathway VirJ component
LFFSEIVTLNYFFSVAITMTGFMWKICFCLYFLILFCSGESGAAILSDSLNIAPFGNVYIYNQKASQPNVVIMISGDNGWKSGVIGFAQKFSEKNALVIGVDIRRYFKELKQRAGDCYNITADFVNLATVVEKKYNFSEYKTPVIMGYSSGATLVYGILAQARPGTFKGGISLGFCPDIELPKMFCQINGLSVKVDSNGKRFTLQPDSRLGNSWIVLQGKLDNVCNYPEVADFVKKTADAELIPLPGVGHGFSKWSDFMPQWIDAYNRLTAKNENSKSPDFRIDDIKNVPLVITDSKIQNIDAPLALFISGDGGWYSFEQLIADKLAENGITTLGLDSKKYFWNRKTPEETADDIIRVFSYYGKSLKKDRFLLIGYSLGAEIVPFIVNRFPEEMKAKICMSVLLSPDTNTDFEIHISNMLGMGNNKNTYLVIDEIKKMKSLPAMCIFGEGEKSKVPDLLKGTQVKINLIPGDHHYKFNVHLIMQTMRDNKAF